MDHLAVLITIISEHSLIDWPRRTNIIFEKAILALMPADACNEYLAEAGEERTVEIAEKTFRKAVDKACALFIPAGRIRHFHPTLKASTK